MDEKAIGASELILTSKGTIYHLDLHPDDIAPLIITVGDPDRVAKVSRHFDRVEVKKQKREFVTHTGFIGKKRISVISTGIGTDNIDIVLNELDALVNIDFQTRQIKSHLTALDIIRIGTCGGLQADIPLDSFVVSQGAFGLDELMPFYETHPSAQEKEFLHHFTEHMQWPETIVPYYASASPHWLSHFSGADFIQGITVTCSGFYAPQGRALRAKPALTHFMEHLTAFAFQNTRITNFEMETAGIFGLANVLGHRACSISAIVANRALQTFSADGEKTTERLIKTVLEKL